MAVRDFTLTKYKRLCMELKDMDYKFLTFNEYFENPALENIVMIRHDIDNVVDHKICKRMASLEKNLGIKSTYYIRVVPKVINFKLLKHIEKNGHEIGYHYEVLNLTRGDLNKSFLLFSRQLELLRKYFKITTICQHGGMLGKNTASTFSGIMKVGLNFMRNNEKIKIYDSRKIWKEKNFLDYGIIGDSYLSVDYNEVKYFSDTGISWNNFSSRVLDNVEQILDDEMLKVKTTDDLILHIRKKNYNKISLLVHPINWIEQLYPWFKLQLLQILRNKGKQYGLVSG